MTPTQIERYARHLVLKEIGGPGQNKLLRTRLVIIGAGGLGGPAALYAAAAGIGHITLIDDDRVEISNLQRQIQFNYADIGHPKASHLGQSLERLNPDISWRAEDKRLTAENATELLVGHDMIMDGTDNFRTRFIINEAAYNLAIPLMSGALGRFDGQIGLFNTSPEDPCYQCFVPEMPPDEQTCSEVGIIGASAGIIGSMMTLEAIKYITGAGESLAAHLYLYDGLQSQGRRVALPKDPNCVICGSQS